MVERQSGHKLKALKTNGEGEYVSNDIGKYCDQGNVFHELVQPYTHYQNRIAERKTRLIMNMVRSVTKGNHLPKEIWGAVLSIVSFLLNTGLTKKLRNMTLEEAWSGTKPSVGHLKVLESISYKRVLD